MTPQETETLKKLQEKALKEEAASKKTIKKGRFMKSIIVMVMLFLFLFTLICLYITYKTSTEPSTLIVSVFAFCGFECGILGRIKTSKQRTNNSQGEDDIQC